MFFSNAAISTSLLERNLFPVKKGKCVVPQVLFHLYRSEANIDHPQKMPQSPLHIPSNTRRWPNVGLILVQLRRRLANVRLTFFFIMLCKLVYRAKKYSTSTTDVGQRLEQHRLKVVCLVRCCLHYFC